MAQDIRDRIMMVIEAHPDMSIRSVSLEAGLSDSALHKFLKGETNDLKIGTVRKIAKALGVDFIWLTEGEGDMEEATPIMKAARQVPAEQQAHVLRIIETFIPRTGTDN